MRSKMYKFFLWFKDHFLLAIEVVFRLRVGDREERKTSKRGSNPGKEDAETEKGSLQ